MKANKRQKEKEMSDTEAEVQVNPIENLVQAALDQNYTAATDIFNDVIGQKMQYALDQEKVAVAGQIYNGHSAEGGPEDDDYVIADTDADDDEELDFDIDDEDLEVDEDDESFDEDDEVEN